MNKLQPDPNGLFEIFEKQYILVPLEVFGSDPYKTLISTVLSARTKDEVTLEASKRLFKKAPDIKTLQKLDTTTIEQLIFPVGFYKTKARHLEKLAVEIVRTFNSIIPGTFSELITLPGVGRKTANLTLNRAFNIPAIAVDTHVHKISNLIGWVKTKTPQETEKELVKVLDQKYWSNMNRLFVSIGRQYTSKRKLEEFLISHGFMKN